MKNAENIYDKNTRTVVLVQNPITSEMYIQF